MFLYLTRMMGKIVICLSSYVTGIEPFDGQPMLLPYGDGSSIPGSPFNVSGLSPESSDVATEEEDQEQLTEQTNSELQEKSDEVSLDKSNRWSSQIHN